MSRQRLDEVLARRKLKNSSKSALIQSLASPSSPNEEDTKSKKTVKKSKKVELEDNESHDLLNVQDALENTHIDDVKEMNNGNEDEKQANDLNDIQPASQIDDHLGFENKSKSNNKKVNVNPNKPQRATKHKEYDSEEFSDNSANSSNEDDLSNFSDEDDRMSVASDASFASTSSSASKASIASLSRAPLATNNKHSSLRLPTSVTPQAIQNTRKREEPVFMEPRRSVQPTMYHNERDDRRNERRSTRASQEQPLRVSREDAQNYLEILPKQSLMRLVRSSGIQSASSDIIEVTKEVLENVIVDAIKGRRQLINDDVNDLVDTVFKEGDQELPQDASIPQASFERFLRVICAREGCNYKRDVIYIFQLYCEAYLIKMIKAADLVAGSGKRSRVQGSDLTIAYHIYNL